METLGRFLFLHCRCNNTTPSLDKGLKRLYEQFFPSFISISFEQRTALIFSEFHEGVANLRYHLINIKFAII